MKGFLYTRERRVSEVIDDDGDKAQLVKWVERPVAALKEDWFWQNPEYALSMLGLELGPARETPNGHTARSIFLRGVSGPPDRNGRNYRSLRIGQIIQGVGDPDPETGECKTWTMVVCEGAREAQPQATPTTQAGAKAPEAAQDKPEASLSEEEVAEGVGAL